MQAERPWGTVSFETGPYVPTTANVGAGEGRSSPCGVPRGAGSRRGSSPHPAITNVRRQGGMEDLDGLEVELGDPVEDPLAGAE